MKRRNLKQKLKNGKLKIVYTFSKIILESNENLK